MTDVPSPDQPEQTTAKKTRRKGGGRKRQASAAATPENQFMTYQPTEVREAVTLHSARTKKSKSRITEEALRQYLGLPPAPPLPNEQAAETK